MSGSWGSMMSRRAVGAGVALGLVALAMLSFAGVAHGKGEYEPNDSRETSYGPLTGGKSYTATFETENDEDWYVFYVKTYSQMDISGSMLKGSACEGSIRYVELFERDGDQIESFRIGRPNTTERLRLTLDPGRYYLKFRNIWRECVGDRYKFQVDPASSVTSSRECGEAILARNDAAPELVKVTGLIANNTNSLAKVDGVIAKQNARLAGLTRHWRKLKKRWKRNGRKISKGRGSRYSKAYARSRLSFSKRKANQRLSAKKRQPKAKLEKASATREEILAKRVALQTLGAQHTVAVSGADRTIAEHC